MVVAARRPSAIRKALRGNPVRNLERSERPGTGERHMRVLDPEEETLLASPEERFAAVLATAVFSGVRVGALLGLRWRDIDFFDGLISVSVSLDRRGDEAPLKTRNARPDIVLVPTLGRILQLLREHLLLEKQR
jgi:integrase